jgi:hypothetical protein
MSGKSLGNEIFFQQPAANTKEQFDVSPVLPRSLIIKCDLAIARGLAREHDRNGCPPVTDEALTEDVSANHKRNWLMQQTSVVLTSARSNVVSGISRSIILASWRSRCTRRQWLCWIPTSLNNFGASNESRLRRRDSDRAALVERLLDRSERRAYMLSYAFLAASKVKRPTSRNSLIRMQYFWHFGSICQFDTYPHCGDQASLARVPVIQLQHAA